MKKEKKQPMRSCIVCRNKFIKKDLTRIVRNAEGEIFCDPTGKAPGRGAYVCRNPKCIDSFLSRSYLERTFKQQIPQETVEEVRKEVGLTGVKDGEGRDE